MKRWAFRIAIALAVCWGALAGRGHAETITFDDVSISPDELTLAALGAYKGLQWNGVQVVHGTHKFFDRMPTCGYRIGIVSGGYAAIVASRFQAAAEIVSPTGRPFDFRSVYLAAGWRNGLLVHFEGFRAGMRLYHETVAVDMAKAVLFTFNFRSIDRLRVTSSGGVNVGVCRGGSCSPGPEVVMDDFSFAFVSASATLASAPPPPSALNPPAVTPPASPAPSPAKSAPQSVPPLPVIAALKLPFSSPIATENPRQHACTTPYHGVQVGTFHTLDSAARLWERLAVQYESVHVYARKQSGTPIYRVIVGCLTQSQAATALRQALRQDNHLAGSVVQVSMAKMGKQLR